MFLEEMALEMALELGYAGLASAELVGRAFQQKEAMSTNAYSLRDTGLCVECRFLKMFKREEDERCLKEKVRKNLEN